MERGQLVSLKKIGKTLGKYKYPALILLLGAALLLWPSGSRQQPTPAEPVELTEVPEEALQEQMERILSCVEGAGEVRLLLTRKTGDETRYQTNTTNSTDADGTNASTEETVLTNISGGAQAPVVTQTVYGAYQGALVVCQGADRAAVRLKMVNAVASLTGLPTDRITVIKMKS